MFDFKVYVSTALITAEQHGNSRMNTLEICLYYTSHIIVTTLSNVIAHFPYIIAINPHSFFPYDESQYVSHLYTQRLKQVLSLCGGWMCPGEEDTPNCSDSRIYNNTGHRLVWSVNTSYF